MFNIPHKTYQHLSFKGEYTVEVDQNNNFKIIHFGNYIENEIFWSGLYGGWEKKSLKIWKQLSQDAKCIFDIGANTGIYSLLAKSVNNDCEIYSFEPIAQIKNKLDMNVELNNFNIFTNELAVSNKTGQAIIYNTDGDHSYSASISSKFHKNNVNLHEETIKTVRLDDFILKENIKKIDLMKIDVEKHEVEVLQGMGKYLEKFKPSILIEVLDEDIALSIDRIIQDCNYLIFDIDEINDLRRIPDVSKSSFRNILLCTKSQASYYHIE